MYQAVLPLKKPLNRPSAEVHLAYPLGAAACASRGWGMHGGLLKFARVSLDHHGDDDDDVEDEDDADDDAAADDNSHSDVVERDNPEEAAGDGYARTMIQR